MIITLQRCGVSADEGGFDRRLYEADGLHGSYAWCGGGYGCARSQGVAQRESVHLDANEVQTGSRVHCDPSVDGRERI
jgi:hypothetical protein